MIAKLAEIKKFLVALGGVAAQAVFYGLLDGTAEKWTVSLIALAILFLTYYVPNEPNEWAREKVLNERGASWD